MLVEDPEERSSADYCHDGARTLLKRISDTRHQESDDEDKSVTTPKPSMHDAPCTVRPDIQLVSSKSLEATFKRTVQVMYEDSGQLTDCHCVVNEGEWSEVLSTQPSQISATSVAMPQASMVDGLLWRHESLGETSPRSSNEAEAIGADVGEAQMKGPSQKRHSKPFCEVQGDVVRKGGKHATSDTEEPVATSGAEANVVGGY
ncbi:hypothetical protein J3458_006893 [Metarhizium acridum]|uniref:uncharacterized protein n=1 Tax=Metarhizium acridum TaxID=92637 RepID=UPI001C6B4576|nr:hypothetical protein J3458_006893 [Metarhizium acridum]